MDKIKPRTLSGFMELPPDKQVQMDKMRAVLAETYARYGFTPLDTPAIEAAEVLLAGTAYLVFAYVHPFPAT